MSKKILDYQKKVLKVLSGKISEFYLAGGTALSLFYFNHRESIDLDFFTHSFSRPRVKEIVDFLANTLKRKIELIGQRGEKDKAKILVYNIKIDKDNVLKLYFVEDLTRLIKKPALINGINVMALEDIYIRKIFTVTGVAFEVSETGRLISKGGREEAKDFYDLYCLSTVFKNLSDFAFKYCNQLILEALIRWHRTYDRFKMKNGLLDLKINKKFDYQAIESHFKKEINKIIEQEIEGL